MPFQADNVTHLINLLKPFRTPTGECFIHPPYEEHAAADDNVPASAEPQADPHEPPPEGTNPKPQPAESPGKQVPLYSQEADQILKNLYGPFVRGGLPNKTQIMMLKDMIAGHATLRPRKEAEVLAGELIQEKPLAAVVVEYAKQGPTKDTPTNWLSKVNNMARQLGLKIEDPTWPTTEDALGKQFAIVAPVVKPHGVVLERHDNERPRAWSVYLEKDAPPSHGTTRDGDVSGGNPTDGSGIGTADTSAPVVTRREPLLLEAAPADREAGPVLEAIGSIANRLLNTVVLNGRREGGDQ